MKRSQTRDAALGTAPPPQLQPRQQPDDEAKTHVVDGDSPQTPICPPHTTERRVLAKIDWHVIPILCLLYLLAFLDRVNIANANVYGLSKDLGLVGDHASRYNTALVIFFVPYIILEIPSNMLLKRFKPRVWLSACMLLFGFTTIMQGLVTSYAGLLATRFFLGVFEAGVFPGCFYLIGMWYRRAEAQKRYTAFFAATSLAGAFGGLLAAAIGKMDGLAGYAAWRWVFIIEGCATVLCSFVFVFTIANFPEETRWLAADERAFVVARLRVDQGLASARHRGVSRADVRAVLADYKVLVAGVSYFALIVPAYTYTYFSPAIIQSYGYDPIETQLHSVPPYAVGFAFAMVVAALSDRCQHRLAFALASLALLLPGYATLLRVHDDRRVEYAMLFLLTMGVYTAAPIVVCWFNMNLGGHHRRLIGSAWQVGFGNIGAIVATWAFTDPPRYTRGYSICLGFTGLAMLSCVVYGAGCWAANRRRDRAPRDVGLTEREQADLGDMSPEYRYLL